MLLNFEGVQRIDRHSHRIHVWYIYLHLVDFCGTCRQIYHIWILWDWVFLPSFFVIFPSEPSLICGLRIRRIRLCQGFFSACRWEKLEGTKKVESENNYISYLQMISNKWKDPMVSFCFLLNSTRPWGFETHLSGRQEFKHGRSPPRECRHVHLLTGGIEILHRHFFPSKKKTIIQYGLHASS